jgi:RNA polymerase sigma-70 factor (ECF subfamily)
MCPIGTVRSRLARIRDRLRARLTRRGVTPMVAMLPPEALIRQTVHAMTRGAGARTAAALARGELAALSSVSGKSGTLIAVLGSVVLAGGLGLALAQRVPDERPGTPPAPRLAPPEPVGGKSLLTNGSVEEGTGDAPRAWTTGAEIPGVQYTWSRDAGHTGKASLCLKKTVERYFPIAEWSQTVDLAGDSPRLKISAWIKADRVTKAILDAQFLDATGDWSHAWVAYIGAREPGDAPVNHDWKQYEGVVAIPQGTRKIVIAAQIYGPGTAWFDDLAAEYTSASATDPLAR